MKNPRLIIIFSLLLLVVGCSPLSPIVSTPKLTDIDQEGPTPTIIKTPTPEIVTITPTPTLAAEPEEASLPPAVEQERSSFGVELHYFGSLPKAAEIGIHWIRYNSLLWSDYQPEGPNQFIPNEKLESNMIAVSEAGLELILIIQSTPRWAQKYEGYYCGPMGEDYLDDFTAFMNQLVNKYSVPPYNVKYFELWNEPDESREFVYAPDAVLGCWGDPEDDYFGGGYYGEMLKSVFPAVKSANADAQVILGGLLLPCHPEKSSYCDMSKFFEGILKAGGGEYFDYANFHSYTTYEPSHPNVIQMEKNEFNWDFCGGQVKGKLSYLKELMKTYEVEKPILLTEVALIDPNDNAADDLEAFEQHKADYLVWLYVRNIARGISVTNWYHLDNYGWLKGGLLDNNNDPLPVFQAYQTLIAKLDGASFRYETSMGGKILIFEFINDLGRIWVLFSEDGSERQINITPNFRNAYDLFGNLVEPSAEGKIRFTRPVYIELDS